ncbi:MAG: baseplate J/gp47 family protein, partial [Anaerovoracaceae bacterium]
YGETRAKCLVAGEAGNGFKPGQIKEIIDVYDYYLKVENITESAGGASEEGDSDFYGRVRDSEESFSTAGPAASYVYHAKTASSLIVDVSPTSPEKGVVDVRVLLKDGELPNDEVLGLVKEALNSDKTRPMTEVVKVSAPGKVEFDIDITYFIPKPSASSADIISEEVKKAIKEYITWQTEKMGRDINPSKLISLIMQKGVKRVDIRSPVYKAVEKTFVASVLNNNVTNGGVEDE